MKEKAMVLLSEFNKKYGGYVCIDEEICERFIMEVSERLQTVDNLYDWVLSNDVAYEVVE